MRRYLLDTTPLSALVTNHSAAINLVTPWMHADEVSTSLLVYGEILEGILGRPNAQQRHQSLVNLLGSIVPYALSRTTVSRYALLRRQLRPPFGPGLIGDVDTLIAATALELNLTLVTTDRDFLRVPNLPLLLLDRVSLLPVMH